MSRATRLFPVRSSSAQGAGTENSEWILVEPYSELTVQVDVTAVSGTGPVLSVTIQVASTNTGTVLDCDLYPVRRIQISSVTGKAMTLTGFGKYVRTVGVVDGSGTPTVTHTIGIEAKT